MEVTSRMIKTEKIERIENQTQEWGGRGGGTREWGEEQAPSGRDVVR